MSRENVTRIWVSGPETARRFGTTDRTLRRWEEAPSLGFPKPMVINNRKFFRLAEIEAFEMRQAARGTAEQAREVEAA